MRYGSEQKEITRKRIIEKAGERFKTDGIVASGISVLMADAGLTNGAFYAHFKSKDELVTATVTEQLRGESDRFIAVAGDPSALERVVRDYLSPDNRDNPALGCPSAALLEEIGRSAQATREAYTKGMVANTRPLAADLQDADEQERQVHALGIFAVMAGTLQIARAVTDPALSDALLEQGVVNVLALKQ
jgi:AcrR family transcriptional regulator